MCVALCEWGCLGAKLLALLSCFHHKLKLTKIWPKTIFLLVFAISLLITRQRGKKKQSGKIDHELA